MSSPAEDTPPRPRHPKGHYANASNRKSGAQDLYETPDKVTREIVKLIPDGVKIIWEPCFGGGAMYEVLADIKDATGEQRYELIGTDFFTEAPDGNGPHAGRPVVVPAVALLYRAAHALSRLPRHAWRCELRRGHQAAALR